MRLEVVVGRKGMGLVRGVGRSGARAVTATIGERCCGWAREWMQWGGRARGRLQIVVVTEPIGGGVDVWSGHREMGAVEVCV